MLRALPRAIIRSPAAIAAVRSQVLDFSASRRLHCLSVLERLHGLYCGAACGRGADLIARVTAKKGGRSALHWAHREMRFLKSRRAESGHRENYSQMWTMTEASCREVAGRYHHSSLSREKEMQALPCRECPLPHAPASCCCCCLSSGPSAEIPGAVPPDLGAPRPPTSAVSRKSW